MPEVTTLSDSLFTQTTCNVACATGQRSCTSTNCLLDTTLQFATNSAQQTSFLGLDSLEEEEDEDEDDEESEEEEEESESLEEESF